MSLDNKRFIDQARSEYQGEPKRIARCLDRCGETHVIIEMTSGYYLDWIGAEFAPEPDEFEDLNTLALPGLKWTTIKEDLK